MNIRIVVALAGAWVLVASPASGQLLTPEHLQTLQNLKVTIYTGLTDQRAQQVAAGTAEPFIYTEVGGGALPVTYYHYRVERGQESALAAAVPLPPGFSLAPISVRRRERPRHYVSLVVYEAGGDRSGLRAEWTTYVLGPGDTKPRVMMLETQTTSGSLDPVDLNRPPADDFDYSRLGDTLTTRIVSGASSFQSSLEVPSNRPVRILDKAWNSASDVIYWRNGVADLQNVNGILANRRLARVRRNRVAIVNQTRWAAFLETRPRWVLLSDERIDTVTQPWVNVTDPSVPLTPAFRNQLITTKATVFSANESQRSAGIANQTAEPITDFFVEPSPPSIFLNFSIDRDQLDALAAAVPLPEGFELARLRTTRPGRRDYFLSLNIYETVGVASGVRAEWSVYVTKPGDPVPRYMVLEAQSVPGSLDAVNLFTPEADVFDYRVENGVISVDIQAPGTSFQATIPLPINPRLRRSALDWTEANNLIYWGNGVADKIYYNGLVYDTQMIEVPTGDVSITDGTAWAPYLRRLSQVLVFQNPLEFIASPWNNLNELEDLIGTP